jgi:hypothetical protein
MPAEVSKGRGAVPTDGVKGRCRRLETMETIAAWSAAAYADAPSRATWTDRAGPAAGNGERERICVG